MAEDVGKRGLLISFGGNALNVPDTSHPYQKKEFEIARQSLAGVATLLERGYEEIVLCHGNGPQVGQIFMQQELTRHEFPRQVTLDVCVADSQGRIGYILQHALDNLCRERGIDRKAFAVITQVVVDPSDPAFQRPTKPIGLFYSAEDAEVLKQKRGWKMMEDAGRGYRRVVPSPRPLDIIEKKIFKDMMRQGHLLIGGGGGGIPVVRKLNGELQGVEAVIDKDHTSAFLARELNLKTLVILTGVHGACLNFNRPNETLIENSTLKEMEKYLAQGEFAEGSMKPKVEAVVEFLKERGSRKAIIAHLDQLVPALEGKAGTHIIPD